MSRTEITTPRLRLRALRSTDAGRIATLINEFDVVRMLTRVPYPYALADVESFVAAMAGKDPAREQTLAIDHAEAGLIGVIGFHEDPGASMSFAELGYWLGRTYWGRGFATEAARALLHWAAESWGKRALVASHFIDNPASGEVLCKTGFLYTGEVVRRFSLARGAETPSRMMVWLA